MNTKITRIVNEAYNLEELILLIRPNKIIHLASISNTEECERNPIKTLDLNGRMAANLCDIIYRNNIPCKLFNASSSELYKGHQTYTIREDNLQNMLPTTMYAICKSLGHQIVDSYRMKYNLPFSNGILFMTESKQRSESFLLKKVAIHARSWHQGYPPLNLGNLDSFRNINHCQDVADAISIILEQPTGDTYVVCGSNFNKVEDLVIQIYKIFNLMLKKEGNNLIDITTGVTVVIVGSCLRSTITAINGDALKLRALGWKPRYTTQAILEDISDSTISLTKSVNSTS